MTPSELIQAVGSTQERESIERLDLRSGYFEKPKYGHDRVLFDPENGLFGIFDGVGGDQNPAETATVVRDAFAADEVLKSMHTASSNAEVVNVLSESFSQARIKVNAEMGRNAGFTTATVAKLFIMNKSTYIGVASAGDSPLMIRRGGTMLLVNDAEPGTGSRISNAIGRAGASRTEDEFYVMPLLKGDKIVLCSDGITGDRQDELLSEEEFSDALDQNDPQAAAERLTELSKKSDDKSVIVLSFGKVKEEKTGETTSVSEKLKATTAKAAAFIAGLGIAHKVRGIKNIKVAEKTKTAGAKIKNGSLNAAAWTVVAKDKFTAAATSKETYTSAQDRIAKSFSHARDGLTKLYIAAGNKISEQREKTAELTEEQRHRRRLILGGVVGAAIVGATVYRVWHGMESSGGGNNNFIDVLPVDPPEEKDKKDKKGPNHHNHGGQGNQTPDRNNQNNTPESQPVPRELSLDEPGSSIWSTIDETAQGRGVELTDAQTYDLVEKTLQHNNLTWEEARHLPVDYQFGIPEEVRRELEKSED